MNATLCSLMLATSSLATGQSYFSGGCGSNWNCNDEGYGRYGSYGSYGGYGTSLNCGNGNCGGGCGSGPFGGLYGGMGPFSQNFNARNIYPGQSFPYAVSPVCPDRPLDKKVTDTLKVYEDKLREFEKMVLESDRGLSAGQLKQMLEARDKQWADKLAESQAKILISIQEARLVQPSAVQAVNIDGISKQLAELADNLKNLEGRVEKTVVEKLEKSLVEKLEKSVTEKMTALATKKDDAHLVALDKAMIDLVSELRKSSSDSQLQTALTGIADAMRESSKRPLPYIKDYTLSPGRGLIVVRLPADCKLYVDGELSAPGANIRSFISPELDKGKRYFYTLRAILERDGKLVFDQTEKVEFVPGQERHVNFFQYDPANNGPNLPAITNKQ